MTIVDKIAKLAKEHDTISQADANKKGIKLGLRNEDGTGVPVGITSKGQAIGYKKTPEGVIPVKGQLSYCGYSIMDLVKGIEKEKRFGFDEVTYLLLTGELPSKSDLDAFSAELTKRRGIKLEELSVIIGASKSHDQMSALHTAVSNLHKYDHDPNSNNIKDVTNQCLEIIAKFPAIVASNFNARRYNQHKGISLRSPVDRLSTAENFLYMLDGGFADNFTSHLFDVALMFHAEHGGGNNSTFATRVVASSGANTYMAISSGIASLSGHLHGGANERVMSMMEDIKTNVSDWTDDTEVKSYLTRILNKEIGDKSGKIYGVGHAVYTLSDPRAVFFEEKLDYLAKEARRVDELNLYKKVAKIASEIIKEEKHKDVSPNVDFYSGFVYDLMKIPKEIYTPVFAMARVAGWCAHRIEQLVQGKIMRPAYISSLNGTIKNYVPLNERN